MEPDAQDNGCGADSGGKTTRAAGESGVRPLPALKENVKRVMFYCQKESIRNCKQGSEQGFRIHAEPCLYMYDQMIHGFGF